MNAEAQTPEAPRDGAELEIARTRRGLTIVWLAPLLALMIIGGLALEAHLAKGPLVEVSFRTVEGVTAGETKVLYRSVEVGRVETLEIDIPGDRVVARLRMTDEVSAYLDEDAQFWIVRPRISGGNISGLSTLGST
ncbi:MAG: MlaD family protein, partial [Pseudomonadota bacterium]